MANTFYGNVPVGVRRSRVNRSIPRVVVELGDVAGIIYRSPRGPGATRATYVHFFDTPPTLACDAPGRRLFFFGGHYRVTSRGIEG